MHVNKYYIGKKLCFSMIKKKFINCINPQQSRVEKRKTKKINNLYKVIYWFHLLIRIGISRSTESTKNTQNKKKSNNNKLRFKKKTVNQRKSCIMDWQKKIYIVYKRERGSSKAYFLLSESRRVNGTHVGAVGPWWPSQPHWLLFVCMWVLLETA